MPNIRVLAVDDEPVVLLSLKFALAGMGYSVDVASSGDEALERFRHGNYDVVITDFLMPRMTGQQLAERLRSENPSTKIILLSGSPPFPAVVSVDLVMLKPFSVEGLRNAISQMLNR